MYLFSPMLSILQTLLARRIFTRQRTNASQLVGTTTRELLPPLGIRASESFNCRPRSMRVQGKAIILSLVGNAAIRSSPKTWRSGRKRIREKDVITDLRSVFAWKKRPFVLFVRLSVYPSGSFISSRVLANTIFHLSSYRIAHWPLCLTITFSLPPLLLHLSFATSFVLLSTVVLSTVCPRCRLSFLNRIDIYSLLGKACWHYSASCHTYRLTLFIIFLVQSPTVVRLIYLYNLQMTNNYLFICLFQYCQ